MLIGKVEEA